MKIRAQQCLTFPSCPMFGKGGGSSHAQQVSTHCRRAGALITVQGPRSYPNSHPPLPTRNNALGEIYVASLRLDYLPLSATPTCIWFMDPLSKRTASWPASIWLVTSKHQLWRWMYSFFRAGEAKGRRARCVSRPCPWYQMLVYIILPFSHKEDANMAYDLGYDPWACPDGQKEVLAPWVRIIKLFK